MLQLVENAPDAFLVTDLDGRIIVANAAFLELAQVDDRDVLIEVEVFTQLLEPGVQVADVRDGVDYGLAVEREDEPQGGVRGRVLGAEVQGVEELLIGPRVLDRR